MTKKKERVIKTFEPDSDVLSMLERAKEEEGVTMTHAINTALREWLTKKGFARKKELAVA